MRILSLPFLARFIEITDDESGNLTYRIQSKTRVICDLTIYKNESQNHAKSI